MRKIYLSLIAKGSIFFLLFYLFFYKYVYGEKPILMYVSTVIAVGCAMLDICISKKDILGVFSKSSLVNIVMCAYSLLTGLFVATNKELLLSSVETYTAFSFVCLVICYISKDENSIDWLISMIIIIDLITAIYLFFYGTVFWGYGHVLPNQNPNGLGMLMDLGVFSILFRMEKNKKHLIVCVAILALFLYRIIDCGSRKCMIAALVMCALWLVATTIRLWREGSWGKRLLLIGFIFVLSIGIIYYYQNEYINTYSYARMEVLGDNKELSSKNRMIYYKYAIDYFMEKPLFGIGFDQFRIWNPDATYAHSTYAEAIADWGLIGCVIYFTPIICVGIKLLKLLFSRFRDDTTIVLFALWVLEVFLGIGQIWFYDYEHLIAWTIIFIYIDMPGEKDMEEYFIKQRKREYKYVKA